MSAPGLPRYEYTRLLAVGVNRRTAEILACELYARHEHEVAEATRAYAAERARRQQAAWVARMKACPDCGRPVRAQKLARHRRFARMDGAA